jgi:hypothetical protein
MFSSQVFFIQNCTNSECPAIEPECFPLTVSCDVTSNMVPYEAQQKADQVSGQQTSLHILLSISFNAMQ